MSSKQMRELFNKRKREREKAAAAAGPGSRTLTCVQRLCGDRHRQRGTLSERCVCGGDAQRKPTGGDIEGKAQGRGRGARSHPSHVRTSP
jgi:hypothetical protein